LSRASPDLVWTAVEQWKLFESLNQHAERILVRRMLLQYKKFVPRLTIGTLQKDLWYTWIRVISNGAPITETKTRNLRVASHLPIKQRIPYSKIIWKVFMPRLSSLRPQWHRKKWVDSETGTIYRAKIL